LPAVEEVVLHPVLMAVLVVVELVDLELAPVFQ
jgi:hypothetical protein